MESIKISVEVNVNLSENTQNFIKSLFTATPTAPAAKKPTAPVAKKPTADAAPVAKKPTADVAPVVEKPTADAAPVAKKPAATASINIEDVRKMLAAKVSNHRAEIKEKLNSLGAPSVTKLDPAKYEDMYNYLNNLS